MKVKVSELWANPFRRIHEYPIDQKKVDALKNSVKETGFWDNLLARQSESSGYEIAYGHHRLEALRQLGVEEIGVTIKPLDDATMLRIMAGENMDVYKARPDIVIETVRATKDFIDAELAKHETWEAFCAAENSITNLVDNAKAWVKLRDQGAGRNIICAFLDGNWKAYMVEKALSLINDESLDVEAVKSFDAINSAKAFASEVHRYNIPKEEQKELAERVAKSENRKHENVYKEVDAHMAEKRKEQLAKQPIDIQIAAAAPDATAMLLERRARAVKKAAATLATEIHGFNQAVKGINGQIGGLDVAEMKQSFNPVIRGMQGFAEILGYGSFLDFEGEDNEQAANF